MPRFHIFRPSTRNLQRNNIPLSNNDLAPDNDLDLQFWVVIDRKYNFSFSFKDIKDFEEIQKFAEYQYLCYQLQSVTQNNYTPATH